MPYLHNKTWLRDTMTDAIASTGNKVDTQSPKMEQQKCSEQQQKLAVAFAQPFRCAAPLTEFRNMKARAHRGNPKLF